MTDWRSLLEADPLPWLLDEAAPAVRHRALRELLDQADDDPEVVSARRSAMAADPIAAILAVQDPGGWWVKPGGGYSPKYTGTAWTLIFLDQLGADPGDHRVRAACRYVLEHAQAPSGGFAITGGAGRPTSGNVAHCLNGNLLRAFIGFGWAEDERVALAVAWQAAAITGHAMAHWNAITPGPGFSCGVNEGRPCGWGAAKAVLALARLPGPHRAPEVARALDAGVEFLLSVDPATAAYPMGWGNREPSRSWFRLGFPSGYVADVLQVMEAVCEAGAAADPRLEPAVAWLLARQVSPGRWANSYAYAGKMHIDIDVPNRPSRWVTLRACRVLKMVGDSRARRR